MHLCILIASSSFGLMGHINSTPSRINAVFSLWLKRRTRSEWVFISSTLYSSFCLPEPGWTGGQLVILETDIFRRWWMRTICSAVAPEKKQDELWKRWALCFAVCFPVTCWKINAQVAEVQMIDVTPIKWCVIDKENTRKGENYEEAV